MTGRSLGAKSGTKSPGRTKTSPIVQDPDSAPRKKVNFFSNWAKNFDFTELVCTFTTIYGERKLH